MRRAITISMAASILLVALAVLNANAAFSHEPDAQPLGSLAASGPAATPTCAPSWAVVPVPSITAVSQLIGVDAVAVNDVWAVGVYEVYGTQRQRRPEPQRSELLPERPAPASPEQQVARTLIERWNGSNWTVVSSPNIGSDNNVLSRVDAVSANDVWAVGYYVNDLGIAQTLTQHWNGTQWRVVPSPNVGPLFDNRLTSVEAVSSSDVWAVGYYFDQEVKQQTLTMRWNGTQWNIVASPNQGQYGNTLNDVAVVSASDVWAVGTYLTSTSIQRSLSLHWNGSNWSIVPSPPIGSGDNVLYSVDALAANDVWAVGGYRGSSSGTRVLTQHWDGTQWTVIGAATDLTYNVLYSVDIVAANDVWAVGAASDNAREPLTLHWDGARWVVVRSPSAEPSLRAVLYSVDALTSQDVWAVGDHEGSSSSRAFVEHYSTACVTCGLRFMDVPEGSTFFHAIQCLACQGIVGGYSPPPPPPPSPVPTGEPYPTLPPTPIPTATPSGPTFRPNANVTRAQFAKIVSNASYYREAPGPQIFQDVESFNTFYEWINRLARRGILGGHPCGTTPAEPCVAPRNLPYFRPHADATRAQIAKIISNAANFTESHTAQTFTDVPTSHAFYIWIARLSSRGIIGGYQCGTNPGEPCGPGNRAYFRPVANGTRGQVSKMVAKAFFPNCYTP